MSDHNSPSELTVVNLTPHPIIIVGAAGEETYPPSGAVAKVGAVETAESQAFLHDGPGWVQVVSRRIGTVTGLPEPALDTVYIVSSMVLAAVEVDLELARKYWAFVYAPDTGPTARRDEKGNVITCTRLVGISTTLVNERAWGKEKLRA